MDGERCPRLVSQMSTPAHFGRSILELCEPARKVRRSKNKANEKLDDELVNKLEESRTSRGPSLTR